MTPRTAVLLLVFPLVLASCGGGEDPPGGAEGDCSAVLERNGVPYDGLQVSRPPATGERLGTARVPVCGDEPARTVDIVAIEGVHPSVAFVSPGPEDAYPSSTLVWLGPGYLVSSPRHPFHEASSTGRGRQYPPEGFRCDGAHQLRVRVVEMPAASHDYLQVEPADPSDNELLLGDGVDGLVSVTAATRFAGLDRRGIPYVERAQTLDLTVVECLGREDEPGLAGLRLVVARKISAVR